MNPYDQSDFLLKKVYSDGTAEEAVVYKIADVDETWCMGRRGFLSAAGIALSLICSAKNGHAKTSGKKGGKLEQSGETCGKEIVAHRGDVDFLAFGNNGKVLVSKSPNDGIKLWEIPSGKLIKSFGKIKRKNSIALSQSSGAFAISERKIVKLYRSPDDTGKVLQGLKGGINAIVLGEKVLAGASSSGPVTLWSVKDGTVLKTLEAKKKRIRINRLALSSDERMLAGTGRENIFLWNIKYGSILGELKKDHSNERIRTMRFDPMGMFLITVSQKDSMHFIKLWDTATGKVLNRIDLTAKPLDFLEFSHDGRLISGERMGAPALWHIPSCTSAGSWDELKITGPVALTPDKTLMAVTTEKGTISLLTMPGRKNLACLFDPDALRKGKKAGTYEYKDQWGRSISSTMPCGSPIPPGAICTCNCVPGRYHGFSSSGGSTCTCNKICTCVPIK